MVPARMFFTHLSNLKTGSKETSPNYFKSLCLLREHTVVSVDASKLTMAEDPTLFLDQAGTPDHPPD